MTDKQDEGLLLTPKERKAIREKVYPFSENTPLNDTEELIDKVQVETLKAQLAKTKQHYEKISPYALPSDAYDKYFTPPEKGLDRPELREKIARVLDKAVRQFEVEGCPEVFGLKVHIDQILALIPDQEEIYKAGYEEACANLNQLGIFATVTETLEEAKREERERIYDWGQELCFAHHIGNKLKRNCDNCWEALKGE